MSIINFSTKYLFIIVLAFIAGICWTPYIIWSLVTISLAIGLCFQEKDYLFLALVVSCAFFFGSTRYFQHRQSYFTHAHFLEKPCLAIGIIQEILPRLDEEEPICILIQLSQIKINDQSHVIHKKIYVFVPSYTKVWLKPHQTIELKNIILKHPRSNSYQEYLIRENIWAVAHQKWLSYTTIQKPSLLQQYFDELCLLPLQKIHHSFSELTHTLYLSIFCGKKIKSETTTKMKELFQYWGISHHLARSGLHLIILIGLLLFLLSWIPCSLFLKQWIMILLLTIYYITTYSSVAFMRAFYMYIFYTMCKQFYLPSNSLHILLVTTLLILIVNPHHLFFLDFQLSFSITLLILWFLQTTQNSKTVAS